MTTEVALGTYAGGAVVQAISAEVGPDSVVVPVAGATISVTDRRVVARAGGDEWSWLLRDVVMTVHGQREPWTILVVSGIPDHGVSVAPEDAEAFRIVLGSVLPEAALADASIPPPPPPPVERLLPDVLLPPDPVEPSPPLPPDSREDVDPPTLGELVAPTEEPVVDPLRDGDPTGPVIVITDEPPSERRRGAPTAAPARGAGIPVLEAREISAWFGTHHVLDRCSMEMQAGQVTALIGPSGCGKSTFLRILNRMHEMIPSAALAGEVLLDGEDIYDPSRRLTDARRRIGMVFQKPNPFPAMSIYDNVVASFKLTGTKVSATERDDVVQTCLQKAGLWNEVKERLRQPGGGLSGGQQQRLCIARALAIRPTVLLMDEPCSALDPTSTRRIEQTIVELADEVTIVIVTHNMQQAARVSHQCAFFLAEQGTPGVIVEHGPTDAMFERPQDPRTLDYVNGRFG